MPAEVEEEGLHVEAPFLGLGQLPFDDVQIAVVDVDPAVVDGQPGAAVEDATAPAADLGDLALPADSSQIRRVERASVVDRQVPVTVRAVRTLRPGTAEGDGADSGEAGEAVGHVIEERGAGELPAGTVLGRGRPADERPVGGHRFATRAHRPSWSAAVAFPAPGAVNSGHTGPPCSSSPFAFPTVPSRRARTWWPTRREAGPPFERQTVAACVRPRPWSRAHPSGPSELRSMVADVRDAEGAELAAELGGRSRYLPLDVTGEDGWQRTVAEVERDLGPASVLVNNAGIAE